MKWVEYSLLSAVLSAAVTLGAKYVLNKGVKVPIILFYAFISGAIIAAVYVLATKQQLKIEPIPLLMIVAIIAVSFLGNYFYFSAVNTAPNPGYVSAISALQTVVITLAAIALFKSEITIVKSLGIAFAVLSVILLSTK